MVKKEDIVKTDPDPTEAVKEALRLAVQTINEKFTAGETAVILAREELTSRLDAMSAGINDKFAGNKELVDQLGKANAVALSAALETQKDLLEQLRLAFDAAIKVVNEKIDRLTSRLDLGEGGEGRSEIVRRDFREDTRDNRREVVDNRSYQTTVIAIVVSVVVAVVAWFASRGR